MTALQTRERHEREHHERRHDRGHPDHHGRRHGAVAARLVRPLDHSPEVLLALAAVLIVVAGPVRHAFDATGALLSGLATILLLAGIVLAVAAAWRLLRERG